MKNRTNMISARVVADSKDRRENRITTMEVVFPRMILAEFNTHRMFSRNSASSRAIPYKKMLKSVKENLFIPMAFQKEHKGMQGSEYHEGFADNLRVLAWKLGAKMAIMSSYILFKLGVSKQLANRLLEPFMYHKVLVTFTESDNFFNLRSPEYQPTGEDTYKTRRDAIADFPNTNVLSGFSDLDWLKINKGMGEIHIMDLAEKMYIELEDSTPKILSEGEWHIPFGNDFDDDKIITFLESMHGVKQHTTWSKAEIDEVKAKIATARCARLSYQTLGDNPVIDYKKDLALYEVLKASGHFSPAEHVSQCMTEKEYLAFSRTYPNDVGLIITSHGWCLNFRGFKQLRYFLQ